MIASPGATTPSDRVHRHFVNRTLLRRANFYVRKHVLRRDLLLRGLGDLGSDASKVLSDLGSQVLVDLKDLQFDFRDLVFCLSHRRNKLRPLAIRFWLRRAGEKRPG